MKKLAVVLFLATVSAFLLSACSVTAVTHLVEVPVALVALIQIGVSILVTFLFTQLLKWGLDFSGYKSQVVAAIVAALVVFINALLAKVPANLETIVGALLNLLVVVLGSFGLHLMYKQVRASIKK